MDCQFQIFGPYAGLEIIVDSYMLNWENTLVIIDEGYTTGDQIFQLPYIFPWNVPSAHPLSFRTSNTATIQFTNIIQFHGDAFRILVRYVRPGVRSAL